MVDGDDHHAVFSDMQETADSRDDGQTGGRGLAGICQFAFQPEQVFRRIVFLVASQFHFKRAPGAVLLREDGINLKTGVIQADKYSTKLNKTYQELAEHYNTAILPARISAPKDKPNAEGAVGLATRWITATVRNKKFFTLQELNQELRFRLKEINSRPFQKREGSRLQVFLHEEKPFLAPLPSTPYELAQ
jgi:virulence-associated protein VapD